MKKRSTDSRSIQAHLYSLLILQDILMSFDISMIEEKEEDLYIDLVEKESCVPSKSLDLVLNGFMNSIELNSFPVSDGSQSYTNTYDFTLEGTKATKSFGSFLKEFGL